MNTVHFVQKTPISQYLYKCHRDESERPFGCDVDVHCDGGHIPCNSAILSASPLLKEHFDSLSPCERKHIIVHMPDFSIEHVTAVIHLLYTGKCLISRRDINVTWEILESLSIPTSKVFSSSATPEDLKHRTFIRRYLLDSDDDNFSCDDDDDEEGEETTVHEPQPISQNNSSVLTEDVKIKIPMLNAHPPTQPTPPPPPLQEASFVPPPSINDVPTPLASSSSSTAPETAVLSSMSPNQESDLPSNQNSNLPSNQVSNLPSNQDSNSSSNLPPPLPTGKVQHQIHQPKSIKVHKDGRGIKIVRENEVQDQVEEQQQQQQNDEEMRDESENCSSNRSSLSRETIVCGGGTSGEENGQVMEPGTSSGIAVNQNSHPEMTESENDNDKENEEGSGIFKRKTPAIPILNEEQEDPKRRKINAVENASDEEEGYGNDVEEEEEEEEEEIGDEEAMSDSDDSSFCDSDIDIPLLEEERQIIHDCKVVLEKLSSTEDDTYRHRLIALQQELLYSHHDDEENEALLTTTVSEQVTTNVMSNLLQDTGIIDTHEIAENDENTTDEGTSAPSSKILRRSSRNSRNSTEESTTTTTANNTTFEKGSIVSTNSKLSSSSSPASLPPPILSPQNSQVEPMNIDSPTTITTKGQPNVINNNSSEMSTTSNQMSSNEPIQLSPINLSSKQSAVAEATSSSSTTTTVEPFRRVIPMNINGNETTNLSRSPIVTPIITIPTNAIKPRIGLQPQQQMITTLPPEHGILAQAQATLIRHQPSPPLQNSQAQLIAEEQRREINMARRMRRQLLRIPQQQQQQQQQGTENSNNTITSTNISAQIPFLQQSIQQQHQPSQVQIVESNSIRIDRIVSGPEAAQLTQAVNNSSSASSATPIAIGRPQQQQHPIVKTVRIGPPNANNIINISQSSLRMNPGMQILQQRLQQPKQLITVSNINPNVTRVTPPNQGDSNRIISNVHIVTPEPNSNVTTATTTNSNISSGIVLDNNNPTFLARTTYDGFPIRVYRRPPQSNNNNTTSSNMNQNVVNVIPVARSSPSNIARVTTTATTTLLNPIQIQRQLENVLRPSPNMILNNNSITNTTNTGLNHVTNSLHQQQQQQQIQIQQRQPSPHTNISIPSVTIQPQLQQERIPIPNTNQLRTVNTTSMREFSSPPIPSTHPIPSSNERIVCASCSECFSAESYEGHLCFGPDTSD